MAKGNLFLGFGRGKVGDVVFSRVGGEQVTRARNRAPRNPQTPLQLLQRVVLKTSSSAFSLMQDIVNHSFQGEEGVTKNQAAFNRANVGLFRQQLATEINSGDPEVILTSSESNFSTKESNVAAINPYIISAGRLPIPQGLWQPDSSNSAEARPSLRGDIATYADLIAALGLQQGDQITVVCLTCDDTQDGASAFFNGFHYGRFILDPSDGVLTHDIDDTTTWNSKNENITVVKSGETTLFHIYPTSCASMFGKEENYNVVAFGIIASRLEGNAWARSDAKLVVRPWTVGTSWHLSQDHGLALLSDAILSYMDDASSLLYLNQATV